MHWLFTGHLRELIGASQFICSPPQASSFGFTRIVHTQASPPLAFDVPTKTASVVWLNSLKPDQRGKTLAQLGNVRCMLVVMAAPVRAKLHKARKLPRHFTKVASFPAQKSLMLSTRPQNFNPKASSQVLEVRANNPARARKGVADIGSFTMPESPLEAIDRLSEARWQQFHESAQDFPHRHVDGVWAATDGAVKKHGKAGVLMSGGVAFREGDHCLDNTGIHVEGPISSFVAEGAALLVLLETVPAFQPLTIMTDSANVMWAMQHCSRRERVPDFSRHPNQGLLKRLYKAHIRRTSRTHYVKITEHSSVSLNECADALAASAWQDYDAPFRSFDLWEDSDCIYYYKKKEDSLVRVDAAELRAHFIQLRSAELLRNQTRTVLKLTAPVVGRHLTYEVLTVTVTVTVTVILAQWPLLCSRWSG